MKASSEQPAQPSHDSGWARRLRRLEGIARKPARLARRHQRPLLAVAFAVFVLLTVLSFRSLPAGLHFRWWLAVLVVLVTAPISVIINAAEFRVMGAANGHDIGWLPAMRLTVLAGVANLLPVPGGVVIRAQALHQRGSTYSSAVAVNAAAGIAWIAAGALSIGVVTMASAGSWLAGSLLAATGLILLGVVTAILHRLGSEAWRHLRSFVIVEMSTVIFGGIRIYMVFHALGLNATPVQAISLTASSIISAAIGIFPGGLGLREALAGAIGALVDLPASRAIAGTAADRIIMQISLLILAAVLLPTWRRRGVARTIEDDERALADPEEDRPADALRTAGD